MIFGSIYKNGEFFPITVVDVEAEIEKKEAEKRKLLEDMDEATKQKRIKRRIYQRNYEKRQKQKLYLLKLEQEREKYRKMRGGKHGTAK
ncbi:hypothetical protein [Aggregatibacter actinomycetemcomitans]|uniref:hypothetical protein n=1 Tax=Aggregatibacter actinomycetemcomitans TaxID=714 RepID=UPI00197C9B50|nr:hypothetical protein [Aggregatibacter actinomycetemcomitans]MBN6064739.1 hypothetical protein [Aggregatibacter actinomycetemcomitans]MBN6076454.1 hypothetical protein [Aggregatibacter actinomycetemcomitans]MBN6081875.1 hypothetical protein [Aggregatibacter actinomycetemcomitans]MBN6084165.1 hypothetical protein [Aggregatibacter actinomycetemcomitans]